MRGLREEEALLALEVGMGASAAAAWEERSRMSKKLLLLASAHHV